MVKYFKISNIITRYNKKTRHRTKTSYIINSKAITLFKKFVFQHKFIKPFKDQCFSVNPDESAKLKCERYFAEIEKYPSRDKERFFPWVC